MAVTRLPSAAQKFPRQGWDAIVKATDQVNSATGRDRTIENLSLQLVNAHNEFERYITRRFPPGAQVTALVGIGEPSEKQPHRRMTATVSEHQKPACQMPEFGLIVELPDAACDGLMSWRDCGRDPDTGLRLIRWGWWEIRRADETSGD